MKKLYFTLFFLCFTISFVNAQLQLISDDFDRFSFFRNDKARFNNMLYVVTYNVEREKDEIWESDGTVEGTKKFAPDFTNSNVYAPTATDSHLFFIEEEPSGNKILWATNGDVETAVKIREGSGAGNRTVSGNKLYFTAVESNGYSFWVTDGTVAGTIKLLQSITHIVSANFGNTVYFKNRFNLYKTDGTIAGTNVLKTFDSNFSNAVLHGGFMYNNEFYFRGCDDIRGCSLWKTDGTTAGTEFVIDIKFPFYQNQEHPNDVDAFLTLSENKFFLHQENQLQIINTNFDTTTLTTLRDFSFPNEAFGRISSTLRIPLNGKVLYQIETDKYGTELWATDGTTEGTVPLNVWKNAPSSLDYNLEYTKLGNFLYFTANDGIHGRELWRTDGTVEGTELVRDFTPGLQGTDFTSIEAVGSQLFIFFERDFWVLDTDTYQVPTYEINRDPNEWFINMGTNDIYRADAHNIEMKLDKDDNIFLIGCYKYAHFFEFFQDTFRVPLNELIEDNNKVFISKFDKSGNLKWAKNIGGYGWIYQNAIEIDDNGNLIVAGYFYDNAAFDSLQIVSNKHAMFLAKYSTDGDLIWLKQGNFLGSGSVSKVESDDNGNIYITGNYRKFNANWDNNFINSIGSPASFVVKYDKDGNVQWAKSLENELLIWNEVMDLTIDNDGNLLVLVTEGTLRTWSSCEYQNWHTELFNLDANDGSQRWKKRFESTDLHVSRSVAVNEKDDILISGHYRGTFQFDEKTIESELGENCHSTTGFLIQLDKFGEVKNAFDDGNRNSRFHQIIPMEGRNFGIIGGINYKDGEVEQYNDNWNLGRHKMFFSEYDGLGNLLKRKEWFQRGGYDYEDFNPSAAIDSENYLVISNSYSSQVDTFSNCFTGESGYKIYLMRTALNDNNFEIFEPEYVLNDLIIGPNPTVGDIIIKVEDEKWFNYQLNIFSANGQLVYSINKNDDNYFHEFNIRHLSSGVLFFQFSNGSDTILKRVVKH